MDSFCREATAAAIKNETDQSLKTQLRPNISPASLSFLSPKTVDIFLKTAQGKLMDGTSQHQYWYERW